MVLVLITTVFLSAVGILSQQPSKGMIPLRDAKACLTDQDYLYSDLCAEESSGYERMHPEDSHYWGVKCAVDSAIMCLEALSEEDSL